MESFTAFLRALERFRTPANLPVGMALASAIVLGGWLMQVCGERRDLPEAFLGWPLLVRSAAYEAIGAAVAVLGSASAKPFIYFQF